MSLTNGQTSDLDFTDSGLLATLNNLKDGLMNGTLSNKQKLLISELSLKNLFIERNLRLEHLEPDILKYALLGAYIYSRSDEGPFSQVQSQT